MGIINSPKPCTMDEKGHIDEESQQHPPTAIAYEEEVDAHYLDTKAQHGKHMRQALWREQGLAPCKNCIGGIAGETCFVTSLHPP